jgi:lysophospholipase L1-like esterase
MFRAVIWFFAAGDSFFWGIGLLIISILLSLISKKIWHKLLIYFTSIVSLFFIFMAVMLIPSIYYFIWILLTSVWFLLFAFRKKTQTYYFNLSVIMSLCITLVIMAIGISLFLKPDMPKERFDKLYIIGDSVSAGVGGKKEETWPKIFINKYGANVADLSVAGATVSTAIRQAKEVTEPNKLVLLEIGGNDYLFATPIEKFEQNLKTIFETVKKQNSAIIMLEIPMLPKHFKYGEIQRKLAKDYNAVIIPKRYFASVEGTKGANRDFIHLSEKGHRLMAEKMWSVLEPSLKHN